MKPRFETRDSKFDSRADPLSQFRESRNPAADANLPGGESSRTRPVSKSRSRVSVSFQPLTSDSRRITSYVYQTCFGR